tara:strand:+ start:428 stop:727 length:300 start_codon:yes stop_codon:yes gene_type:complete
MLDDFKKYKKILSKIDKNTEKYIILQALYNRITIGKCNIKKPLPKIKRKKYFCNLCIPICFPGNLIINFNDVSIYECWKELDNIKVDYAKKLFLEILND